MKKITIIDGYSLLFRAYYATAYPGVEIMRSQQGVPTNAIFAFSNMLIKILNNAKEGEAIFVALDTGGTTFRKEQLETYKANRKPCPEDLKTQFPIARDFLDSLGIFHYEKEGFEGDDVAGTVAKKAEAAGYEVLIYTSDKDYLQLIDDKITVNIIRKGLSDTMLMTPESVKETYGFAPINIIDYKGLRGDPSDNLPGIPGVGEKTAVQLIQQYENFDNIIAHADEIKGKLGENIRNNAEQGKVSRDLAIIQTDINLPFSIDELEYKGYEFDKLNAFAQQFSLKQLMNKIPQKWKKASITEVEINPTTVISFEGINLDNKIGIAIDLEGNYSNEPVMGIAIASKEDTYFISIEDAQNDGTLKAILANPNIDKYCFDYKAIKVALARYGITVEGLKFDVLVAAYLLDSSLKNNVFQAMNAFGVDLQKEEVSLFNTVNDKFTAKVAYFSLHLYEKAYIELEKINAVNLLIDLELPLASTLAEMEIEGFPIDVTILDNFGQEYREKLNQLTKQIHELAGETFNIASPKQVGEILYNKLGLKGNKNASTSFDNLKELIDEHPIIEPLLEYRKYAKLLSTYVEGIKPHIHEDGKIHAHFNQTQTTTGRLSSSEPNLQNISIRDEEGKLIRKAFYYPNHEYEILSLDYSQIELRILAFLSNCKPLQEVFESHTDIHTATAKAVFHVDQPTYAQRRQAKAVNFGIIYGISDFGLADQIGVSTKEARVIISEFYSNYPEVANFFNNIVNEARDNGYVSTLTGRRRYLREIYDSSYQVREFAKRAAMNAPIQGTAADLIKISMIKVNNALKEGGYKSKMVLQIHDELIFKVPKEEKDIIYDLVKNIMEHAIDINVPLEVDGGYGEDWYSCK